MEAESRALDTRPLDAGITAPPSSRSLPARSRSSALELVRDYLALTKPRIIALLLVTTVATMLVADPAGPPLATIIWTMIGGYLAAGGAGAINHYLDREADARMARTRGRPLVSGRIAAQARPDLRHRPRRDRVRAAHGHGQPARRRPGDGRPARLRVPLHALAEAPDAPEHRHRGRRGSGPAIGRLGGRDRLAAGRGLLSVRDRLLLDAAPFLGPLAVDQGRLRAHWRADAAGRPRRGARRGARSSSTRSCCSRSACCR